jgi:hypothetical protein
VEPGAVRLTDEALFAYHLVFVHGRLHFELTPSERRQLRTYLERGGMVFADAICSSTAFSASFRQELRQIFPALPLQRIPADHPLLTSVFGGENISSVTLRRMRTEAGRRSATAVHSASPDLEGLAIGDRYALIFSPYDISCALDSIATPACEGYTPEDALRIAMNVLLYSCQ